MLRWLALLLTTASLLSAQTYEGKTLVTPKLLANTDAVVPGQPLQVGILLDMAPTWHTYWLYAGDAGFATALTWKLPAGFSAGEIQWPIPHHLLEPGEIEVYAYGDQTMLLVTITPPAQIAEKTVTLQVDASWLVCAEICIPGKASLELTLPVNATALAANAQIFDKYRAELPKPGAPPYSLTWKRDGKNIVLEVGNLGAAKSIDLYPLPAEGQIVGHTKEAPVQDGKASLQIEAEGGLKGVLVVEAASGERAGWTVSSGEIPPSGGATPPPSAAAGASPAVSTYEAPATTTLWLALFYGFLGGLILNLMPCVLPVISLKIFGFVRQAGSEPGKILRHGLAFAAGIFAWFFGLAALVLILKASGSEVTWAFQFQNPWFNLAISCIVFVFALNLFGVFEILLPGAANNLAAEASSGEGYSGSFFQGVFATLLATPCTAPFLGTALGFAFSQSGAVILAMFGAVALGMSSPYILLSAKPGWMKILPKPGAWMERVKQFMGFPLLATLLWLLSILGSQKGLDGLIWASAFLLCLALACWIYGAFCGYGASRKSSTLSIILILALVLGGGWYFLAEKFAPAKATKSTETTAGGIAWQPFSTAALDKLLAEGKPVFVDFTADWCISCKFNERTALDVPDVRSAFAQSNIIPMKADWTNANPEITAALKKFGRVGVPLYVLYPAGRANEPIILPELLTQQIVLEALNGGYNASSKSSTLSIILILALVLGGGWYFLAKKSPRRRR